MNHIKYNTHSYSCKADESILDMFLRNGIDIPFSCKNGICQSCLMRSVSGKVPEIASKGLKDNLVQKNYFKACTCIPCEDMEVSDPLNTDLLTTALIAKKEWVASDVCRFLIEPAKTMDYHSGQFINIHNKNGETRSYSLSSVPTDDYYLEIYVKKVSGGVFSQWMCDTLSENDDIEIQGANGDCIYSHQPQPLLLIGTGTGISPLYGIAREALLSGHDKPIYLYHGSRESEGLFLDKKLRALETQHPHFHYTACVSGAEQSSDSVKGRANDIALAEHSDLTDWTIFLCGQPDMVKNTQIDAIKRGADPKHINADPFWVVDYEKTDRRYYPEPDLEMWAALGEGVLLNKILHDFYDRIYDDPQLSSFFEGTTKQRSIEKQYSFTYQVFTGENVFFGDRPRNAHHWMVITNEMFDYRQTIMAECQRAHGLPEKFIKRWFAMEDEYRAEMVKDKPWNLIKFGKEMPPEGFEELTMDATTLCDNCQAEVNIGDVVRYHTRLGKIYCKHCMHS